MDLERFLQITRGKKIYLQDWMETEYFVPNEIEEGNSSLRGTTTSKEGKTFADSWIFINLGLWFWYDSKQNILDSLKETGKPPTIIAITDEKRRKIIDAIKKATKDFSEKNYKKEEILTEKEQKIVGIVNASFGCERNNVKKLLSCYLYKDLFLHNDDSRLVFSPCSAVVPIIINDCSHNYPLDKVCLVFSDRKGIRADGTVGNALTPDKKYIRPATEEEIDKIPDCRLEAIMNAITIIFL